MAQAFRTKIPRFCAESEPIARDGCAPAAVRPARSPAKSPGCGRPPGESHLKKSACAGGGRGILRSGADDREAVPWRILRSFSRIWKIRGRQRQASRAARDGVDRAVHGAERRRDVRRHGPVRPAEAELSEGVSGAGARHPSHDTFSRLFRLLDPRAFHTWFIAFMQRFAEACQGVVALDGKTLRRSFDRASAASPLHLVSAWAADQRLVLGQLAVGDKSNEIVAVPKLLELLSLNGMIVTADALNCQRQIARQVPGR